MRDCAQPGSQRPSSSLWWQVLGSKHPSSRGHPLGMSPRASHASHQQKNENLIVLVGSLPAKTTSMVQCTCSHILHCIKKSPGETIKIVLCVWLHHTACAILVSRPGIKPVLSAVEAWSVNHWTAREGHGNNKNTPSLLVTSASCSAAFHSLLNLYFQRVSQETLMHTKT